jgi:hypothetical protein
MVIESFSMPFVSYSNMISYFLKFNLNFNEQNRLHTFFDTNIDIITKGIDVGYCSFYQTLSCRTSICETYCFRYRQWIWTLSFAVDACLYFHYWYFFKCIRIRHKQPSHVVFTAFLPVQRAFLLVLDIVKWYWLLREARTQLLGSSNIQTI